MSQYSLSLPVIFSDDPTDYRKGRKLFSFLNFVPLDFGPFQFTAPCLSCWYRFCRGFSSLFSWKINAKNLLRTAAALLRCFLKICSYAVTCQFCFAGTFCLLLQPWVFHVAEYTNFWLCTNKIFFILCARKSQLCFAFG